MSFRGLEKVYDCVDREGLWKVPQMYGLDGQLLDGIKSFYVNTRSKVCIKMRGEKKKGLV